MKRPLIITAMIIATTITVSGQTPAEIVKKWKEIQACCDKYDDGSDSAYRMLNEQIALTKDNPVANAIWHSSLAQFLSDYYSSNRYRVSQRTEVADETPADYKEWDARTFDRRIQEEYFASLKNADAAQGVAASSFSAIVENPREIWAEHTLYDILARPVISYMRSKFNSDETSDLSLRQNPALWDPDAFLNLPLSLTETNDDVTNILSVYQSLEKYHAEQHHESVRINYLLVRFDFMRVCELAPDKSLTWYIEQLTRVGEGCKDQEAYSYVAYKLGTLYAERSDDYDPEQHPEFRNDLVIAADYLKASLQKASPKAKTPHYEYEAKELLKKIQKQVLQIRPLYMAFPTESPLLVDVEYKDVTKAYIRLIPISSSTFEQVTAQGIYDYFGNVISIKPSFQETLDLPDFQDHRKHVGHYVIPRQQAGGYLLIISSKPVLKTYKDCDAIVYMQVSDIHVAVRNQDEQVEYLVVNRQTGEPLENAAITFTTGKSSKHSLKTNRNGMAVVNKAKGHSFHSDVTVEWNKQVLHLTSTNYWWTRSQEEKSTTHCDLFLDRKLYRPGQTVYFKGIVSETVTDHGETQRIQLKPFREVKVHLFDANYQEIDVKTLITNDFGSFSDTFLLPSDGLMGRFEIQVRTREEFIKSVTFSMEEYKRPTFEVTLNAPAEAVRVGQTVTVTGSAEALSGYPIDGASVSYKVTRRTEFPWWRYGHPSEDSRTILTGTAETDADGSFSIAFLTEEDPAFRRFTPLYVYVVEAVVTDINGETHSETSMVRVSRRSLQLAISLPEEVDVSASKNKYSVSLTNIAEVPQNGEVLYEIYQLKTPDRLYFPVSEADATLMPLSQLQEYFPNLDFQQASQQERWDSIRVAAGTISCSASSENWFSFPNLASLPKGYYRVKFKVQDPSGDWIEEERTTHLYFKEESQCSGYKSLWHDFSQSNPLFSLGKAGYSIDAGDTLKFSFGTYLDHAQVLCEIAHNDSVVFAQWYELRNNTVSIALPTKQTDRGWLSVHLYMMVENNTFEISPDIRIVNHLQDVRFEFLRFRDKTLPGSQEELQVRLTDKDGKPISAELLCSMYDYSLDVLGGWNYHNLAYDYQFNQRQLRFGRTLSPGTSILSSGSFNTVRFHSLLFNSPDIDLQSFYCGSYGRYMAKGAVVLNVVEDNISVETDIQFEDIVGTEACMVFSDDIMVQTASQKEAAKVGDTSSEPQLRTNFNETAFFYPQLRTDENGVVFFSFTMPDALTKWKMQGVAHNHALQCGRFEKYVQTRKELMVVPNAPRFLREGDTMDFSAKLVNTSDKHLCGYVTLEFFNAVNNQSVNMLVSDNDRRDEAYPVSTTGNAQYDVEPGASQEVHFRIIVPEDVPAITYRIIARNTDPTDVAGDGEEKTLPVLINRMMVTEAMPFYIFGKGSKMFTFNKLRDSFGATGGRDGAHPVSTTLKHYRLTVECTPNPSGTPSRRCPT